MIRFANACVGHLRGGLAMAAVLACMLFAAVSGSSPATVVAVGSIVIAGMVGAGYTRSSPPASICNAGTLGILIPPSIVMVVYGAATETSVGKLFLAGVVPGILLGLMLMVAIYVARADARSAAPAARVGWRTSSSPAARRSGGLLLDRHHPRRHLWRRLHADRGGRGCGRLRVLDRGVRLPRHRHEATCPRVLARERGKVTVMLMFIIANALLFAHVLTTERIPQAIAADDRRAGACRRGSS